MKPGDASPLLLTDGINQNAVSKHQILKVESKEALKTLLAERSSVRYLQYSQSQEDEYLRAIRRLISKDLSEPYSIYVYRYFLYQWGHLSFLHHFAYHIHTLLFNTANSAISHIFPGVKAVDNSNTLVGVVISKLERHRSGTYRGYIAMLAVEEAFRGQGIATRLVCMAVESMKARSADEVVLETEVTNAASLRLYESLGFLRSKRLHRYYLNGNTAFRLVLCLKNPRSDEQRDF